MPMLEFQIEEKPKYKHEKDTDHIIINVYYNTNNINSYHFRCIKSLDKLNEICEDDRVKSLSISYRIKALNINYWDRSNCEQDVILPLPDLQTYEFEYAILQEWQFKEEDNDKRNIIFLPKKIVNFNCSKNYCSKLPELPYALEKLDCSYNRIYSFDFEQFPINLIHLDCNNCRLTELPELPPKLESLNCNHNKITHIQFRLPKTLKRLECNNNIITKLPHIHEGLTYIDCSDNNIQELSFEVNRLLINDKHIFSYKYNPVYGFIAFNFNFSITKYFKWKIKYMKRFVRRIEDWFLDCKYNPKYKYCRERLEEDYKKLF